MRIVSVQFLTPVLFGGQTLTRITSGGGPGCEWRFEARAGDAGPVIVVEHPGVPFFIEVPRQSCVLTWIEDAPAPVVDTSPAALATRRIARKRAKDATE